MASFNKVILIGNMTADPEIKQTPGAIAVCTFSIAVNRRMSKNNEVDFITIQAWRQSAEFVCKYFKKGQPILVCGELHTRTWNDNKGNKRYAKEVVAEEVSFVGSKESSTNGTDGKNHADYIPSEYMQNTQFEEIPQQDTLPF